MDDDVTLRPDPGAALRWSFGAVVLLAIGIWLVDDSGGSPFMWSMFGLMVAVSGWFVLQLLVPSWFEVHVGLDGIRARTAWQHLDVPWQDIRSAGIRQFAGEPYLHLSVIAQVSDGWVVQQTAVLLPLGADLAVLRMAIARARARSQVSA